MAVLPLVPKTNMADVGKLISFGNLLVMKVMCLCSQLRPQLWFCSVHLVPTAWRELLLVFQALTLSHFSLTEIAHSLHLNLQRPHTLFLLHFDFQQSTPRKCTHSAIFFFLVRPFRLELLQPRTQQPQKFYQTPKETKNQHGRRHMPSSTCCYISIYRYLTWNSPHAFYSLQDTFNI